MQALGIMAFLIMGGLVGDSLLSILPQPHVQSGFRNYV
ncbi:hypothetical protein LCGC14_0743680 [marine sediment metagenome]|uniref:Uncharacterized protein n=1 Tax=marine sediment metagenome TaxID=412755 RepID=A0A0F9QA74_9ZZZZ